MASDTTPKINNNSFEYLNRALWRLRAIRKIGALASTSTSRNHGPFMAIKSHLMVIKWESMVISGHVSYGNLIAHILMSGETTSGDHKSGCVCLVKWFRLVWKTHRILRLCPFAIPFSRVCCLSMLLCISFPLSCTTLDRLSAYFMVLREISE